MQSKTPSANATRFGASNWRFLTVSSQRAKETTMVFK